MNIDGFPQKNVSIVSFSEFRCIEKFNILFMYVINVLNYVHICVLYVQNYILSVKKK